MPGIVIRAVPKATYDFHTLPASTASPPIIIAKNIDVTQYKYVDMVARIHNASISSPAGASITLDAYSEAPSPEDPSVDFYGASALNTIQFTTNLSGPYPLLSIAGLMGTAAGGYSLRIRITAQTGGS